MTTNADSEVPRIEVEIYNMVFRLRAPVEEHDRLKRAARHVDNVLRELVVSQTSPDTTRLAIQAAFLISHDYLKIAEDITGREGVATKSVERMDDLLRRLDESLEQL